MEASAQEGFLSPGLSGGDAPTALTFQEHTPNYKGTEEMWSVCGPRKDSGAGAGDLALQLYSQCTKEHE